MRFTIRASPLLLAAALLGCPAAADDDDDYWADLNLSGLATTDGSSFDLSWSSDPSPVVLNELFSGLLAVSDGAGAVQDAVVQVDATMPAHGHGMTVVPVTTELGAGDYEAAPLLFHMAGHWQIVVTVDGGAGEESAVFDYRCCD